MLKITGEVKTRKYLTIDDITMGDIFSFVGEEGIYMYGCGAESCYMNLQYGTVDDVEYEVRNKPIVLIEAELAIKSTREE